MSATNKRHSWKWRVAKWIGLPVLVAALGYGGYEYAMDRKFYPTVPPTNYSEPADLAEARAQDLDYLKVYLALEQAWPEGAREAARAALDNLKVSASAMSAAHFDLEVGRIVALSDNGHSNVFASVRARRFGRVDIRTHWFHDGLYVLKTSPEQAELVGLKLVAINDVPVEDHVSAFGQYYGGVESYKTDMSPYFIEAPEVLAGAGFAMEGKSATYRFERPDGSLVDRILEAAPANPDGVRAFPHEWMFAAPKKNEPEGWVSASSAAEEQKPLYLQKNNQAFIRKGLPELDAYYIQLRQNYNSDTQKIGTFLAQALKEIKAVGPKTIILDVRFNGGGDYTTTSKYVKQLPLLVPDDGHVYLISDSHTFSAGMSTMGFVKQVSPKKVTILGQAPGDRMRFWSEGDYVTLPNSSIVMRFSTGYVDMVGPCNDYTKCYWKGAFYPIEVDDLSPDVEISLTFSDYMSNVDPVMAWLEQKLGG